MNGLITCSSSSFKGVLPSKTANTSCAFWSAFLARFTPACSTRSFVSRMPAQEEAKLAGEISAMEAERADILNSGKTRAGAMMWAKASRTAPMPQPHRTANLGAGRLGLPHHHGPHGGVPGHSGRLRRGRQHRAALHCSHLLRTMETMKITMPGLGFAMDR